jgi:hypothetical protein
MLCGLNQLSVLIIVEHLCFKFINLLSVLVNLHCVDVAIEGQSNRVSVIGACLALMCC